MTLQEFNNLNQEEANQALFTCCGSIKWVKTLMTHYPFKSEVDLVEHATRIWYDDCSESDWKASFLHHPKIGDLKSLANKFAATKNLAGEEQAGVETATIEIIEALAQANEAYETKNGFVFIVCATGKSAAAMLRLLQDRLSNQPAEEIHIAMGEQAKITMIRLKKLMPNANWTMFKGSQLTTHVLDTSLGKPGQDLSIKLQQFKNENWQTVCQGVTNEDGRIADLLPPGKTLTHQHYKIIFNTASYFKQNNIKGFYPEVAIQFTVMDDKHYHVPLLINPFGYSTYRGS